MLVAALLVLLGAVAVTAGMSRPAAETAQGFSLPPAALLAWGMSAAVVGGLALAVLMPAWTRREKWTAAMLGALLLLGFAVLAERQHADQGSQAQPQQAQVSRQPQPSATASTPQTVPPPSLQRAPAAHGPAALAPWLIAVIGAAALLLALLALGSGGRGRGGGQRATAAALDAAMAASMRDLEREADPRRAIVAAWLGMGEVLARHGRRREQHEAPLEYLRRCLDAMQVSRAAAQRLTTLFQRARYSDHPATEAMRGEALDALRDVRKELQREGES